MRDAKLDNRNNVITIVIPMIIKMFLVFGIVKIQNIRQKGAKAQIK